MSKGEKFFAAFIILFLVTFFGSMITYGAAGEDKDQWIPYDGNCFVHHHEDNRLFGQDNVTTKIYCTG